MMHSALVQELADLCRRDTEVSVPVLRRHRLGRPRGGDGEEAPAETPASTGEIAPEWVDPGNTLAKGTAIAVILREAVVRRNHRATRALRRAAPLPVGCVEIDWARATERWLVKRIGRGVLRIGVHAAAGTRVSIGIDGRAFGLSIAPRMSPVAAIADRLSTHYHLDLLEEPDGYTLVVLTGHRARI